jgi:hypothetical protein
LLDKDGNGDALVAAVQVTVVAEFRAAFDGVTGILFEDAPFLSKNDAGDEALLFAAKERSTQGAAKRSSLPRGAIAVNDLDGDDARSPGLTEFVEEKPPSFVNGGEASFDVQGFERRHERTSRIVPEGDWQNKRSELENSGKREMAQDGEEKVKIRIEKEVLSRKGNGERSA